MPLSEKLRIELFLPDNPHPAYKALLATFQEEFTTTFGGCTVLSNLEGQYRSEENRQTITDRIQILFVDTNLQPVLHQQAVEQYLHQIYETTMKRLRKKPSNLGLCRLTRYSASLLTVLTPSDTRNP